ncbi:MAG: hypothetical protein P8016_06030 [Sedimentisphaerales bacterium]
MNAVNTVLTKEEVVACQQLVRRIPVSKHVLTYAVDLATASRPSPVSDPYINEYVEWGAGVRASQYLILGAKSLALLRNLPAPSCKEIRDVALPVLGHRILRNYKAAGKGITTNMIIQALLKSVKEADYTYKDGKKDSVFKKATGLTSISPDKTSASDRISLALNKIRNSPKTE